MTSRSGNSVNKFLVTTGKSSAVLESLIEAINKLRQVLSFFKSLQRRNLELLVRLASRAIGSVLI